MVRVSQKLMMVAALTLSIAACDRCSRSKSPDVDLKAGLHEREDVKQAINEGKFKILEVAEGSGSPIEDGKTAAVHYTGWLTDGKKFDSSRDRGEAFPFPLGSGRVIKGWDEGVKGMRPGGKRILVIPADMGYGINGYPGVIPPNATLLFEVELIEIR